MRKVVFDIETSNTFEEAGGANPERLDLSIVCIHDSETNRFDSYIKEDLPRLWPILEKTDLLIGYNSDHFDIPLLNKYYPGDLSRIKSVDLLREIKNAFGRRLKLDTVADATLGVRKSGNGLQAITWWRAGEIEKVKAYCLDDVKITKDIYDYARKNGHVKYRDLGDIREIKLDTSHWEEAEEHSMTHTLPF